MIKDMSLSLSKCVSQVEGNIVSDMDGETVMLNVANGKYYNLGQIGGVIWELMRETIGINQIVSKLISDYEVERTECEEQVLSFLEALLDQGLITTKGNL